MHKNIQSRRCGVRGRDFRPRTTAERRVLDMKISRIKLVAVALTMGLSFSTVALIPAHAAATQADVDYSTQVSQLTLTFATVGADYDKAHANPPTLAFGSKFKAYKERATKSSDKFLLVIKKLKSLTPSPGFAKSGPMLTSSMDLYDKAVSALKAAINKNDTKAIENANKVVAKAGSAYLAWSKAYAADLAALNG